MQSTSTISGAQVRPGRRGPGSKPRRARSIEEFSTDFETVASDRGYARLARRVRKEEKRQADKESGALDARRRELQAAVDRVHENTATEEQRELVREASDVEFFAKRYDGQQSAYDRIFGEGFVWPGGMVAGKYLRAKFVETGLRTWRHPFFQRVAASMAKASSCRFRTGPAKDRCVTQHSKLHGLDQPFGFFCDECRDMFRLDYDKTFDNEAQMRAWIAHKVQELGLTCGPHMAVWIPDDRAPGKIIRPHFLFLLPEGHAVWPRSPPDQHRLLGEVIAALTRAFECDPGGLANPFHGKIPTSPLTESVVIQDTHMPTLGEYAESMDLTYGQDLMLRKLMTERMEDAGFDKADSNTWFSAVRALSNAGGKTLFKSGADITDPEAFCSKIADLICRPVFDEIQSTASQRKTVDKLIETCTRYTAYNFDPAKMDTIGRDRGAAAHLM